MSTNAHEASGKPEPVKPDKPDAGPPKEPAPSPLINDGKPGEDLAPEGEKSAQK